MSLFSDTPFYYVHVSANRCTSFKLSKVFLTPRLKLAREYLLYTRTIARHGPQTTPLNRFVHWLDSRHYTKLWFVERVPNDFAVPIIVAMTMPAAFFALTFLVCFCKVCWVYIRKCFRRSRLYLVVVSLIL